MPTKKLTEEAVTENEVTAITVESSSAIAPEEQTTSDMWSNEKIQLLKTQIAKDCSDDELALFLQVCKRTGLDPFSRQIYAISRKTFNSDTKQYEPKMSVQVSIDGFRLIAARSGLYDGSTTEWCGLDGVWKDVWLLSEPPAAAKTTVYRLGTDRPFVGVCTFKSYAQTFNGKLSGLWAKMPETMLGKVSEALALRKAFPAELSGLYTREEMDQADNQTSYSTSSARKAQSVEVAAIVNKLGVAWEDPGRPTSLEASKAWAQRMLKGTNLDVEEVLANTPADEQGKKGRTFLSAVEALWSQN